MGKAAQRVGDGLSAAVGEELLVGLLCARVFVEDNSTDHLVRVWDDLGHSTCSPGRVEERSIVIEADRGLWGKLQSVGVAACFSRSDGLHEVRILERGEAWEGDGPELRELWLERRVDNDRLAAALRKEVDDDGRAAKVAAEELRGVPKRRYRDRVDQVGELAASEPVRAY